MVVVVVVVVVVSGGGSAMPATTRTEGRGGEGQTSSHLKLVRSEPAVVRLVIARKNSSSSLSSK